MTSLHPGRHRMAAGFGLIELMIAMVLGLLVLGAAIAVFQSNQRSYRSNEGVNRVQEGARVAYEMMSRDIRSAGTSACTNEGSVLGTDANSVAFRAPLAGTASTVTAVAADDQSYRVESADASSVTLVPVAGFTPSDIFQANRIVMVCNGSMAGFTTVLSTAGNVVTFKDPLEFDPSDTERAAPGSISIALFRNAQWSVAANGRESGSSLWVNRNGQGNQEVADGVQSLALTYRQFAGGNPAAYVSNPSDFNFVDGVRLGVAIRAPAPREVGDSGVTWITRNASATVGVRSRSL